jgi:hypothetical protein
MSPHRMIMIYWSAIVLLLIVGIELLTHGR